MQCRRNAKEKLGRKKGKKGESTDERRETSESIEGLMTEDQLREEYPKRDKV